MQLTDIPQRSSRKQLNEIYIPQHKHTNKIIQQTSAIKLKLKW